MFKLSENIDPNKVFIVNRSELEGRIDPEMILYSMKNVDNFKYPCFQLKKMLLKSPQYGANEASVIRINNEQPRYIRITDIDENGTLRKELGATADTIDSKYILNNNDILFARSGATVGKTYIHKVKKNNYKAFFAGYMIRFIVNPDIIIPDFVFIYTQLSVYKKWVKATQRAAGQPNINAEEYKSLKIPLPPLEIQQQIVDLYEKAYTEKQQKEAEAQRLLDSIDDYLLEELGITLPKEEEHLPQNTNKNSSYNLDNDNPLVKKGRLFLTNLSEVTGKRIDPDYNSKYFYCLFQSLNNSIYPFERIKKYLKAMKTGTTPNQKLNAFTTEKEIPFLRNTNLKKYEIDIENTKYIRTKYKDFLTFSYKNEVIMCIAGTIGISSVNIYDIPISINQNVSSLRFSEEINPFFISYWFNTNIFLSLAKRASSVATILYLNNDNLKSLPIPIPPLEKQNEMAVHISQIRNKANALKLQGKEILEQVKQEVERMILGD